MKERKKEFACRRVLGLVSEYLLFKEGMLPRESLSDLCKEVFDIADDIDSKNHDDDDDDDDDEAVDVSECNINIIDGYSSSDSDMSLQEREAKRERNIELSSSPISKKHNNIIAVSKKSLKRKAKKKRSAKKSPSEKHDDNDNNSSNNNNNVNNVVEQEQEQEQEVVQVPVPVPVQEPAVELPAEFRERIEEMGGEEVMLVIEKQLTKSDVNSNNGRFSIPKGKIREEAKNFLTPVEEYLLEVRELKGKKGRLTGMSVSLLDPTLQLCDDMCFKKWEMDTTDVYNITRGWNDVVTENNLRHNDRVQLWSFRSHNQLHFALVKL